jgi:DNA-binding NtrC family response regulator
VAKVLIVEDEAGVREGLVRLVESRGHVARVAASLAEARETLAAETKAIDCVLLDLRLKDGDGLDLLREIRARGTDPPVIVATAYGDSDRTIAAMKAGAFEYLTKPFELPILSAAVERALRSRAISSEAPPPAAPSRVADPHRLVGASAAMLDVWKAIGRVAGSSASVLIVGETGTGKELVARAVHEHSSRAGEPFVAVNLASLAPTLIESELFGHEKGAFTGALARRAGRFEVAAGGTIFLDEIGDLDPTLQTKLLRVLQDGTFERVGGGESLTSTARVVAATNKPVRPNEPGATLRQDLYFRLAVVEIALPALRSRRSDVPLLVAHALARTKARAVTEDAMRALVAYDWPGNVRELVHVVERAAVMCSADVIDAADLPDSIHQPSAAPTAGANDGHAYESMTLRDAVAALEKRMIERALERAGGNRAEAARLLGIARPQLYAKMDEHGIARKA